MEVASSASVCRATADARRSGSSAGEKSKAVSRAEATSNEERESGSERRLEADGTEEAGGEAAFRGRNESDARFAGGGPNAVLAAGGDGAAEWQDSAADRGTGATCWTGLTEEEQPSLDTELQLGVGKRDLDTAEEEEEDAASGDGCVCVQLVERLTPEPEARVCVG